MIITFELRNPEFFLPDCFICLCQLLNIVLLVIKSVYVPSKQPVRSFLMTMVAMANLMTEDTQRMKKMKMGNIVVLVNIGLYQTKFMTAMALTGQ